MGVYEAWCETCYQEDKDRIEKGEETSEEEKVEKVKKIKKYKYIGETARSIYERGMEHQLGLEKMAEDNHLMKHVATHHSDMEMEDVRFGIKVIKFTYSALERQVLESVRIQEERKSHYQMNSKAE